ncbi:MAG: multidrug transporter subunit MdtD [Desulfobulbus sp.]|nr:multidrug transporter subunit MdtD [Desulfobulbus sp.]
MKNLTDPVSLDAKTLRIIPWIVAIAFFMQTLDTSIMNTALPAIATSLHENPLHLHWVVIAYMLTVALLMPVSGWVADRFGTRTALFGAILFFMAGSLFSAAAPSLNVLITARVVQGMGGAFMMPVGRLVVLRMYPRQHLVQVLSFVSIPGMVGPLLGPTVGGFLVQYTTWHWIFLINLPVGLIGCVAVLHYIPNLRRAELPRFDIRGFVLFGAAMLLISFALDSAGQGSLPAPLVLTLTAGGGLCIGLYVIHARLRPNPLFRLSILRIRTFTVGLLGNIFARLASGGMPYLTPLLLQVLLGYSPVNAGLIMIPMALMAIFSKALATQLLNSFGYRVVLFVNTVALGGIIALYSNFSPGTPLYVMLIIFGVFGAVNSLQFTAMNTLTLIGLPDEEASSGNSLLSVIMQLSMSLGVAVAASLMAIFLPGGATHSARLELAAGFRSTYLCIGGISVIAALIFLCTPKGFGKGASQRM